MTHPTLKRLMNLLSAYSDYKTSDEPRYDKGTVVRFGDIKGVVCRSCVITQAVPAGGKQRYYTIAWLIGETSTWTEEDINKHMEVISVPGDKWQQK